MTEAAEHYDQTQAKVVRDSIMARALSCLLNLHHRSRVRRVILRKELPNYRYFQDSRTNASRSGKNGGGKHLSKEYTAPCSVRHLAIERGHCPVARKMIDLFEDVQRHELSAGRRPSVVFTTKLSRLQRRILWLLNMSGAYET